MKTNDRKLTGIATSRMIKTFCVVVNSKISYTPRFPGPFGAKVVMNLISVQNLTIQTKKLTT